VTVAVSLADKLDTLVGFFGIGKQPTGSRDPFAFAGRRWRIDDPADGFGLKWAGIVGRGVSTSVAQIVSRAQSSDSGGRSPRLMTHSHSISWCWTKSASSPTASKSSNAKPGSATT
jgi:hypothetical protein